MKVDMAAGRRMKCDEMYRTVLDLEKHLKGDGYDLFELAQCFIEGYDPDKLRHMLTSEDEGIVSDGLFVLNEIPTSVARNYAAEIEALTRSTDNDIRRDAAELAAICGSRESKGSE